MHLALVLLLPSSTNIFSASARTGSLLTLCPFAIDAVLRKLSKKNFAELKKRQPFPIIFYCRNPQVMFVLSNVKFQSTAYGFRSY